MMSFPHNQPFGDFRVVSVAGQKIRVARNGTVFVEDKRSQTACYRYLVEKGELEPKEMWVRAATRQSSDTAEKYCLIPDGGGKKLKYKVVGVVAAAFFPGFDPDNLSHVVSRKPGADGRSIRADDLLVTLGGIDDVLSA